MADPQQVASSPATDALAMPGVMPPPQEQQMMPASTTLTPPLGADTAPSQPPMQPSLPPRPVGTSAAGQPMNKAEFFRDMLGKFFYAVGTGLANRGTGPEADLRGAGAALSALPNREILQRQLAIQEQNAASERALREAQTSQYQNTVMTPYGPMNAVLASKVFPAAIAAQGRENVAQTGATAKEKVAQIGAQSKAETTAATTTSKEKMAAASLAERTSEFQQTDKYKKWKAQLDNDTKVKVAELNAGKAPAALVQTAVFADGGLTMMNDAKAAMTRLEQSGVMGQDWAQNKVENWIFGKGAVDPRLSPQQRSDIGKLRAALGYTSSAAMRAHTGRTSQEIYGDFKSRLGANQDWAALNGALDETSNLLTHYRDAASNANVQRIRAGTAGTVSKVDALAQKYGAKQ